MNKREVSRVEHRIPGKVFQEPPLAGKTTLSNSTKAAEARLKRSIAELKRELKRRG